MNILTTYYLIINIIAFTAMAIDKFKAQRHMWRIPEATLLGLAAIGGAFGAYLAMVVCRHKTRHKKFTITLPILCLIHIGIILYLI